MTTLENRINTVSSIVFGQMLNDETIVNNTSPSLLNKIKNLGVGLVVGVLALSSTGIAHADTTSKILNTTIGVGMIAGIMKSGEIPDGTPYDCKLDGGKSGTLVTLGSAVGALVGKQIGNGSGKHAAIVAGGILGGVGASAAQDASMRDACLRQNAGYQQQIANAANGQDVYSNPQQENMRASGSRKKVSPSEVYNNTPSSQYNRTGHFAFENEIERNRAADIVEAVPAQAAPSNGRIVFRNAKGEVYNPNGTPLANANIPTIPVPQPVAHQPVTNAVPDQPFTKPEVRVPTKVVANVPQNTILYAFQYGRKGPITYVTAKDSPGVASMVGKIGNAEINPALQQRLDHLHNKMLSSFAGLEMAGNEYVAASNGTHIDNLRKLPKGTNRSYIRDRIKNFEYAQKDFSESRADFMELADSAALQGYKLDRYSNAIQYLDDGPLVNRLYKKKLTTKFTKFNR